MRLLPALAKPPKDLRYRHFFLEMLVALSLAFLVWLYARTRSTETLDMIALPVQVHLAPGTEGKYDLEIQGSNRVVASFTGPPSAMRELRGLLQRGAVEASVTVAVPEERQKENTYREAVEIQATSIPVPPGVTVVVTEGRNRLHVILHRLAERHLPVRLEYAGDSRISQVKIEPASVLVRGPKATLDRVRSISTQPYCLPAPDGSEAPPDGPIRAQVTLVSELEGRPVQAFPAEVSLRYRLHPLQQVFELNDVPVAFLCPPRFPFSPRFDHDQRSKVNLRVLGPAGDEPPAVQAYVDLTQGDAREGRTARPLRIQLPRDFQLAGEAPQRVSFTLEPLTRLTD